ncbi:hypothetical protein ACHAWF_013478 [Thalassiosira exigua]
MATLGTCLLRSSNFNEARVGNERPEFCRYRNLSSRGGPAQAQAQAPNQRKRMHLKMITPYVLSICVVSIFALKCGTALVNPMSKVTTSRFAASIAMSSDGHSEWGNPRGGSYYQSFSDEINDQDRPQFSRSPNRQEMGYSSGDGDGLYVGTGNFYDEALYDPPRQYQQPYQRDYERGPLGDLEENLREHYNPLGNGERRQRFGRQDYRDDFNQNSFDDGRRESNYGDPQPPHDEQTYFPEYWDGFDSTSRRQDGYEGEYYYNEPPSQPYDGGYLNERRRPRGFGTGRDYFEGDDGHHYPGENSFDWQQAQQYGSRRGRPPRYGSLQRRQEAQQRRSEIMKDKRMGYGPGPGPGLGAIDRMMGGILNPFWGFGMMDRMMEGFQSDIQENFDRELSSVEGLLDDARGFLLSDKDVVDVVGDDIRFGPPFARSSSSAIVNGVSRSRLQLGVPIKGRVGTGCLTLLADEDGIIQLEVDVGGRVVNVPIDTRIPTNMGKGGGDVIDADVIESNVEY